MKTDLFSKHELASFHDAVYEACNKSLTDTQLRFLFRKLPDSIKAEAQHWGLSNTVVGDSICVWVRNNKDAVEEASIQEWEDD